MLHAGGSYKSDVLQRAEICYEMGGNLRSIGVLLQQALQCLVTLNAITQLLK